MVTLKAEDIAEGVIVLYKINHCINHGIHFLKPEKKHLHPWNGPL
jgi:hypothetical protein